MKTVKTIMTIVDVIPEGGQPKYDKVPGKKAIIVSESGRVVTSNKEGKQDIMIPLLAATPKNLAAIARAALRAEKEGRTEYCIPTRGCLVGFFAP